MLCCLVPVVEAIGSGHLCPWPPSLLPTLHTAIHNSRSPAPSCSPGSTGGPIQGPALLLALTDAVLALGPHFSHYADWGPALVDLMGQVIWPWDCDLLEPSLELYGALAQTASWPGRRRL